MISSLSLSFFFSNNELNLSLRFDTSILIRIDFVVVELKTFPPYVLSPFVIRFHNVFP